MAARTLGLAALLVPPIAWLAALGFSYVVHDFSCLAAASTGSELPGVSLLPVLLGLDAVLLTLAIAAGVAGYVVDRRAARERREGTAPFLGGLGVLSALMFGFGIVLIGVTPLLVGPCS